MAKISSDGSLQRTIITGVNLMATGTTIIRPAIARRVIPVYVDIEIRTLTGVLTVPPICRVNAGGSTANIAALLTLTGSVIGNVWRMPLIVSPLNSVDITSTGVGFEVQTAATATTMTGDVHFLYYYGEP